VESEDFNNTLLPGQRRHLRSLGHSLSPMVFIGKEGMTDNLINSINDALNAHELIKIKLGPNCPLDKKTASLVVPQKTNSELVQLIGKILLVYRDNPEQKDKNKIRLPKK